jgi:hypothetical protein
VNPYRYTDIRIGASISEAPPAPWWHWLRRARWYAVRGPRMREARGQRLDVPVQIQGPENEVAEYHPRTDRWYLVRANGSRVETTGLWPAWPTGALAPGRILEYLENEPIKGFRVTGSGRGLPDLSRR